jgi:hypothetical protein
MTIQWSTAAPAGERVAPEVGMISHVPSAALQVVTEVEMPEVYPKSRLRPVCILRRRRRTDTGPSKAVTISHGGPAIDQRVASWQYPLS